VSSRLLAAAGIVAAAAPALLAAGCGDSRARVPNVTAPLAPKGIQAAFFPSAGVFFAVPGNWTLIRGRPPQLGTVTSRRAEITVWRYPRSEPLPVTAAELEAARLALVSAARARDSTLRVASSKVVRVAGAPALELLGSETVGSEARRVRSTHVFAFGAEVVIDALAPAASFARVDATVFRPVLGTLRLIAARAHARR